MGKNKKFSVGKKLYSKAKKLILSGNMQISKNPEQFLSNNWPIIFLKQKDVTFGIWMETNFMIYL